MLLGVLVGGGGGGGGGGLESVVEKVRVRVIAKGERLEGFWPQILVLFLSWPECAWGLG